MLHANVVRGDPMTEKVNESQIDFLKPCPFCGHKAICDCEYPEDDEYWVVKCGYCCAMTYSDDKKDAIRLWNTRVVQ